MRTTTAPRPPAPRSSARRPTRTTASSSTACETPTATTGTSPLRLPDQPADRRRFSSASGSGAHDADMFRARLASTALAAALLVVTACGDDDDDSVEAV